MIFFFLFVAVAFSVNAMKTSHSKFVKTEDFEKLSADFDKVVKSLKAEIEALKENCQQQKEQNDAKSSDIEERVAALEEQVTVINDDIADLDEQVENAEGQIVIIKSDQVLQDQRLLDLEDDTEHLEVNIQELEDAVTTLEIQDSTLNASIIQMDSEITGTLEVLAEAILDLQHTDSEVISIIGDLQGDVYDVSDRLSQLELDGTIAFSTYLGTYTSIPLDTGIIFPNIDVNLGNAYNATTGIFTVPPGGSGLYYFYTHFRHNVNESAGFDIRLHGTVLCAAYGDGSSSGDAAGSSCGTTVALYEGDVVYVYYSYGTDDTPVFNSTYPFNAFIGFRIAPA